MSRPPSGVAYALALAALGYRVFPIHWPSKVPAIRGWQKQATRDAIQISKIWLNGHTDACVGIAMGEEFLAMDLDVKGGKRGVENWVKWCAAHGVAVTKPDQITLTQGHHHIYRVPPGLVVGNSTGTLPADIDVRGNGGYIAGYGFPPAVADIHEAPEAVLQALRPSQRNDHHVTNVTVRPPHLGMHPGAQRVIDRILRDLDALEQDPRSLWNNAVYKESRSLLEFADSLWSGYTREQAHEDLLLHAPQDPGFGVGAIEKCWSSAVEGHEKDGVPRPEMASDVFGHPIFDATPVLSHIRQAAHSRNLGSAATLLCVLGRVLADTPPGVLLPGDKAVGVDASLNLGFALLGQSGGGKSAIIELSKEILGAPLPGPRIGGLGSGEGLIDLFLEYRSVPDATGKMVRSKVLIDPPKAILDIDEIGRMEGVQRREGSTLMPILRTAITGGDLTTSNSKSGDSYRQLPSRSYRLVVFLGVQPDLAGTLVNDYVSGTLQRFLLANVRDKTGPKTDADTPDYPGSLHWISPFEMAAIHDHLIVYPEHIKAEIRANARAKNHDPNHDPRVGHLLLTRLKVSASLAFLHGEIEITDQWWNIAGHIMAWSNQEIERARLYLQGVGGTALDNKGRDAARIEEASDAAHLQILKATMLRRIENGKVWWTEIRESLTIKQRQNAESALAALVSEEKVAVERLEYKGRPLRKLSLTTRSA